MVEESIIRGMTKENISRSCRSLSIELERAFRRASQRVRGLAKSRRPRRGHSDGIHTLTLSYAASHSIVELSTQNTYEITPVFAKRHHCNGRKPPSHTQKTDRQLPINTWRQYHLHLGLVVYPQLDHPDIRALNVNALQLVDTTQVLHRL